MTAYRRYPRRDDLVEALVRRETQRFLAAVADAIDAVEDPHEGVAEAFIGAVTFAREHPMLRRAGHVEPAPIDESDEPLKMGSAFIANYIHGDAAGRTAAAGALGRRRVRPAVLHLHLDTAGRPRLRRRRRTAAVRPRGADADGGTRRLPGIGWCRAEVGAAWRGHRQRGRRDAVAARSPGPFGVAVWSSSGYVAAFVLLTMVLRAGSRSASRYGIWGALGTAVTAVLAAAIFGDPFTWPIVAGIGLIIAGVLFVEFGSRAAEAAAVVMWLVARGRDPRRGVRDAVAARVRRFPQEGWIAPRRHRLPLSFYLLWLSLWLGMPVGIAYGVWTACGVALVAVIARFLFGDPLTVEMGVGHRTHRGGVLTIELVGAVPTGRPASTPPRDRPPTRRPGPTAARPAGSSRRRSTPTISGAPTKPIRISHATTVRPVPGRRPGSWSAPCIAAGITVATPRPAAAKPAMVPAPLGKASAAPIPAAVTHTAAANHRALPEAVDQPVADEPSDEHEARPARRSRTPRPHRRRRGCRADTAWPTSCRRPRRRRRRPR